MASMVLKTTMLPLEDVTVFVVLVARYYLKTFQIFKKRVSENVLKFVRKSLKELNVQL